MIIVNNHASMDLGSLDFTDILENFDDGVVITDARGGIVFYNHAQAKIDGLVPGDVIGKNIPEVYHVTAESSPTMQCLNSQKPYMKYTWHYRTRQGRQVSAVQNVFPLFRNKRLMGAICFVREYSRISKDFERAPRSQPQRKIAKGTRVRFVDIIGSNPGFRDAVNRATMAAGSPSSIMLYGESGTGKELFAQSIHNHGKWKQQPFVAINCSAIPENLLEGILFGTSKGAFTDAMDKAGLFEQANGGTLFLDEVNSMPVGLQAKLLRVLQEKKIRRVGSMGEIDIDLKIISSVNVDPEEAIRDNCLRRDIYYRLAVVFVNIPPLRYRSEDIEELTRHFIDKCNRKLDKAVRGVSAEVMRFFKSYAWPGNVRELEHVIEGAMNLIRGEAVLTMEKMPAHFISLAGAEERNGVDDSVQSQGGRPPDLPSAPGVADPEAADLFDKTLFEFQAEQERAILCHWLEIYGGNAARAARKLGISRQLIYHKLKKHNIRGDRFD